MNNKIDSLIDQYQGNLERKERLLKPFKDMKSKLQDLQPNEEIRMSVLEAEIRQLKEFIDDLKYLKAE